MLYSLHGLLLLFRPTNIRETKDIIRQLKNKGSELLDLHPLILKENIELFSYPVMILYNFSLQLCIFPELLKIARVAPVFKSDDPENIDNYRPISSLPVLSKLFERLTLNRMLSFIYEKDILSANQFGFRKGGDISQAIVKLTTHITQAFHNKVFCACFFLGSS